MFRPRVTSRFRRALSGLALAGALAAPALGSEPAAEAAVRADAAGPDLGGLAPLAPVSDPGLRDRVEAMQPLVQGAEPTIETVEETAQDLVLRTRPQFPVVGDFNWGQSGAQFGAGRSGRTHEGQDVFARTGTPLVAVRRGQGRGDRRRRRARQLRGHLLAGGSPHLRLPAHEPARRGSRRGRPCSPASGWARWAAPGPASARTCTSRSAPAGERRRRRSTPRPLLTRWAQNSESRPVLPPGTD